GRGRGAGVCGSVTDVDAGRGRWRSSTVGGSVIARANSRGRFAVVRGRGLPGRVGGGRGGRARRFRRPEAGAAGGGGAGGERNDRKSRTGEGTGRSRCGPRHSGDVRLRWSGR